MPAASASRLGLCAVLALLGATMAHATPRMQRAFITHYPNVVGSKLAKCVVCHQGQAPHLNPYGKAFMKAAHRFPDIEGDDSDGDGYSNLAEIRALTYPGDPKDKPAGVRPDTLWADSLAHPAPDSAQTHL